MLIRFSKSSYNNLLITLVFLFLPIDFPPDELLDSLFFFSSSSPSSSLFSSPVTSFSRTSSLLVSACGKKCKKHVVAVQTKKVIPVPVPYPVYPKKKKKCCRKKKSKHYVVHVPDKCCKKHDCCNKSCGCGGGFGNYGYGYYYDYLAPPIFYDYGYYDYYGGGGFPGGGGGIPGIGGGIPGIGGGFGGIGKKK